MNNTTLDIEKVNLFSEIKEDVENYFCDNKILRFGNYKIYIKSILFIAVSAISYLAILFFTVPLWILACLYILLGTVFAGIGFNIMHDGGHGSYSRKNWLNRIAGYSLNLLGGNIFLWKTKHNHNHHNYTNIKGMDDDIDIEPWVRTHLSQPKHWYHRYQHIYALGLYGLTHFNWVFVSDFKSYFAKKIGNTNLPKMNLKEHFIFWISKAIFFTLLLIIPIALIGFWKAIMGFAIMSFVCGIILGTIFQLAHLIEDAEFPVLLENSNKTEKSWVLHQIATTANFATKNKFVYWFTGGLNFQVVHHLFPRVSHIHYREINKLIRHTCSKYKIKYIEYSGFFTGLRSHILFLKRLGAH